MRKSQQETYSLNNRVHWDGEDRDAGVRGAERRERVRVDFVEQFSAALAKHAGFRDLLSPTCYFAVSHFMRNAILDKIDYERKLSFSGMRASPYSWINTIGTFGTAFPAIIDLWE